MMWGGIITFAGWGIYGLIANNLNAREAPAKKIPQGPAAHNGAPLSPVVPIREPVASP